MKIINKILILSMTLMLWACGEADKEFVHDSNTISQMICKMVHDGSEFRGDIHEFDRNGQEVIGSFTQEDVEGGYGLILFEVSKSLEDDIDLTRIYLVATLSWDQFIEKIDPPGEQGLSGRHDITGDGIIIQVKSGVGTKRQYRVRGYYQ